MTALPETGLRHAAAHAPDAHHHRPTSIKRLTGSREQAAGAGRVDILRLARDALDEALS